MTAIDVRALGFTYVDASRPAVRDVSFAVHAGEVFGFLGPSGAGKSTTQNILIRLLSGYAGHITVRLSARLPGPTSASWGATRCCRGCYSCLWLSPGRCTYSCRSLATR